MLPWLQLHLCPYRYCVFTPHLALVLYLSSRLKSFSVDLLNDKCTALEGAGAGCLWILAAAVVKPEDVTEAANPQSPPSSACRCPSCGYERLTDVGAALGQQPPRPVSLWASASPTWSSSSTAQEGSNVPWKGFSHCAGESWEACARACGLCTLYLIQT